MMEATNKEQDEEEDDVDEGDDRQGTASGSTSRDEGIMLKTKTRERDRGPHVKSQERFSNLFGGLEDSSSSSDDVDDQSLDDDEVAGKVTL